MSAINRKTLLIRFLTALILGPACLYLVYMGGALFTALVVVCYVIVLYETFQLTKNIRPRFLSLFLLGLYCTLCVGAFYWLGAFNTMMGLALIILVAASDVGAYFTGKKIGGPKLLPAVSPNKTWAGLGGAIGLPLLFALAWLWPFYGESLSIWALNSVCLALMVGLSGQAGDFLISFIKRKANAKDAGAILPGHGGLLDRVDGLMLTSLVASIYVWVAMA